ncbi:hypothetical protein [uncultured Paraglaciecola sp.]|uniref:hypothetical protein n=1 Tax=uncultured Paraglaciecola sp. TaxID=1765024 RepID=UPI0026373967|nr:hypothetical protein [uncultured Paraglaciecola sp.]
MFNQVSLFIMLLTPVIAYVAGALLYSFVECLRKNMIWVKYPSIVTDRNGH